MWGIIEPPSLEKDRTNDNRSLRPQFVDLDHRRPGNRVHHPALFSSYRCADYPIPVPIHLARMHYDHHSFGDLLSLAGVSRFLMENKRGEIYSPLLLFCLFAEPHASQQIIL